MHHRAISSLLTYPKTLFQELAVTSSCSPRRASSYDDVLRIATQSRAALSIIANNQDRPTSTFDTEVIYNLHVLVRLQVAIAYLALVMRSIQLLTGCSNKLHLTFNDATTCSGTTDVTRDLFTLAGLVDAICFVAYWLSRHLHFFFSTWPTLTPWRG